MKRRTFLAQTSSLVLLLGAPHIARGAGMLAVRMWPSEDYTRVTIESDWKLETHHFMLKGPDRFVVDIQNILLNEQFQKLTTLVQVTDPYVQAIRVAQNQQNVVRIVFDLKQPATPNVFTLDPVAEYKNRLVFDFKPTQEIDPLSQLSEQILHDKAQALSEGNQKEADLLGEWLSQAGKRETAETPPAKADNGQSSSSTQTTEPGGRKQRRPTSSKTPVSQDAITSLPAETTTPVQTARSRLRIIAIDPGHGGEDPGAIGRNGTYEKNIVLAIGKLLRDQINAQPNMRAYMTRDADFFVPLATRVEKARSVKADLFISIHADAHTNRKARGASVYALSESGASSATARLLANKENQSDLIGGIDVRTRDKQTANILISMSTASQIKNSIKLGGHVITEMQKFAHMHKKQVEHAGFAVLKAPDIPSILVETAFISHPEEEQLLRSSAHQKKIAIALAKAVKTYLT